MTITIQPRQSVIDLALQCFGSPEAAFLVAEKLGCAITDELTAGVELECLDSEIYDKRIAEYYAKNRIVPATALVNSGIGFMEIEYNFTIA